MGGLEVTIDPVKSEIAADVLVSVSELLGAPMGSFEVAEMLALAFGDACGMLGVSGASPEDFERLNEVATKQAFDMAKRVYTQATGAGRA